jgi:hypothetical protein
MRQCTITHGLPLAHLNIRPAGLVVVSVEIRSLQARPACCCAASLRISATLPSPKPTTSSAADPQIARHSCTATLLWLSDPVAASNLKRALDLTATAFVSAEDAFHVARTCQNYCPLALATTPPQSPCICSIDRLTRAFRTSSPSSAVDEDTPF